MKRSLLTTTLLIIGVLLACAAQASARSVWQCTGAGQLYVNIQHSDGSWSTVQVYGGCSGGPWMVEVARAGGGGKGGESSRGEAAQARLNAQGIAEAKARSILDRLRKVAEKDLTEPGPALRSLPKDLPVITVPSGTLPAWLEPFAMAKAACPPGTYPPKCYPCLGCEPCPPPDPPGTYCDIVWKKVHPAAMSKYELKNGKLAPKKSVKQASPTVK